MSNNMITTDVSVQIVNTPAEAPNYDAKDTTIVKIAKAIVVGKGTESGKPTVDLQLVDAEGKQYLIMTTGAILEMLGGVAAGKRTADEEKVHGLH